jgi:PAS domain-containing protein
MFHAVPVPLLVLEPLQLRIVAANDAYLALSGMRREALLGQQAFKAFPEDPADPGRSGEDALRASLQRVLATGRTHVLPVQRYAVRLGHDSSLVEHWWSVVNAPVIGADGQVALVINFLENVTELVQSQGMQAVNASAARAQALIGRLRLAHEQAHQAQATLQHSEQSLQRMADAVPEILWATDTAGHPLFVNEQWARYTGLPHDMPPPAHWRAV